MQHPNNHGKGTYTEKRREFAMSPERRKYHREWSRNNAWKYKEKAKVYRTKHKEMLRWSYYRSNARKRGISFELDRDFFENLIKQNCVYCGDGAAPLNGIDRKDNTQGYTLWNSVACCEICNHMKYVLSPEAFIKKCIQIVDHHIL